MGREYIYMDEKFKLRLGEWRENTTGLECLPKARTYVVFRLSFVHDESDGGTERCAGASSDGGCRDPLDKTENGRVAINTSSYGEGEAGECMISGVRTLPSSGRQR